MPNSECNDIIRKVLVLYTGGTIGMRKNEKGGKFCKFIRCDSFEEIKVNNIEADMIFN